MRKGTHPWLSKMGSPHYHNIFALFLHYVLIAEQHGDAPQARRAHHGVDNAADQGGLAAEDGSHQVELEDADEPLVNRADNREQQSNFIRYHCFSLLFGIQG